MTLQQMLTGTKVFELPYFQRRYKWGSANWEELWADFLEQYDHEDVKSGLLPANQGHFLGSIVLHPAPGPVSTVARYLLIDGQQRLTTFLTLVAAFRDYRSQQERTWNPAAYNDLYLTNPYNPEHGQRLIPTMKDRESYRLTVHQAAPTGQIGRCYRFFIKELRKLNSRDGGVDFNRFENSLLLRMLVVEITTSASDDVNHIFRTLNHSGLTLSPLDLIRNHTFMQLRETDAERSYEMWMGIESTLGEQRMERYLWAQLVRSNPKATQRKLYDAYTGRLKMIAAIASEPVEELVHRELAQMVAEVPLFVAIDENREDAPHRSVDASNSEVVLPQAVNNLLDELDGWGSQVHLPLTLELLSRLVSGKADEVSVCEALQHIQSFMVRRALCGIPTNNLNRIFTSMPVLMRDSQHVGHQVALLLSSEQRYWPTDREVMERAASVPLMLAYRPEQVRFLLTRLEAAERGQATISGLPALSAQHILPARLTAQWRQYLLHHDDDPEQAVIRANTIGNLVLVPIGLNPGNALYEEKRELLQNSDLLVNAGVWAANSWTSSEIESRSVTMAQLATTVWRRPEVISAAVRDSEGPDLESILLEVPESSWTTVEALSELLTERVESVMARVNELPPVLAVKVLAQDGLLPEWPPAERREALVEELDRSGYEGPGPVYETAKPLSARELQHLLESASESGQ